MIIAEEKRKNNISEYILYMWQVEDIIRALQLDKDKIEQTLVDQYQVDEKKKKEIANWYSNLVLMMEKEQLSKSGHLQFIKNITDDLNRFHLAIINEQADSEYLRIYNDIKGDIELVRNKSGNQHHDIEVALNTLYLILMLKMKKQEITEGTQKAVWKFGNFMGYISKLYKAHEQGDFTLETYS
jgi:hypothetical protein